MVSVSTDFKTVITYLAECANVKFKRKVMTEHCFDVSAAVTTHNFDFSLAL
jgi:hypothetical protein